MRLCLYLFLLGPMLGTLNAQVPTRGALVSDTILRTYTTGDIQAEYDSLGLPSFVAPIQYEVEMHKIVYWTLNAQGTGLTFASGAVLVPLLYPCGSPLVLYNHGTVVYDEGLPSDLGQELLVGLPFATGGYAVAMPDYLGLGEGLGRHPFMHAQSEATCGVDMVRATRNLMDSIGAALNGQIFIGGYSQGAHVSLAQQREMETQHPTEFDVAGVAAGGGPYDLSTTMRDYFFQGLPSQTTSAYFAYMMLSYQSVYGNLYNDLSEVFVSPYDVEIPKIFNRFASQSSISLPTVATSMVQPAYIQAVQSDSMHPFNVALRDNDVYDWTPQAALRMFYCEADEVVPYQNSIIASNQMNTNGAVNVVTSSVGPNNDHGTCALPSFLQIKFFADARKQDCSTAVEPEQEIGLRTYLVPGSDDLQLEWDVAVRVERIELYHLSGQLLGQAVPGLAAE
ncbi:MAG: lipase family protein, partial [Bacteroidota bacterium]